MNSWIIYIYLHNADINSSVFLLDYKQHNNSIKLLHIL